MNSKSFYRTGLVLLLAFVAGFATLAPSQLEAAAPDAQSWQQANGGTVDTRLLQWHRGDSTSVRIRNVYIDSTILVGAVKDTSKWYPIAGARGIAVDWYTKTRNDSAKVTVNAELSGDTLFAGNKFTVPVTSPVFSVAFSTSIAVGGTGNASGDSTIHTVYYFDNARMDSAITNPSKGIRELATSRYIRFIATPALNTASSKDTLNFFGLLTRIWHPDPGGIGKRN